MPANGCGPHDPLLYCDAVRLPPRRAGAKPWVASPTSAPWPEPVVEEAVAIEEAPAAEEACARLSSNRHGAGPLGLAPQTYSEGTSLMAYTAADVEEPALGAIGAGQRWMQEGARRNRAAVSNRGSARCAKETCRRRCQEEQPHRRRRAGGVAVSARAAVPLSRSIRETGFVAKNR